MAGTWNAEIACDGGAIAFQLELNQNEKTWQAFLINGSERIPVPNVEINDAAIKLSIDHYDSVLLLEPSEPSGARSPTQLNGQWTKRRGADQWVKMKVTATKQYPPKKQTRPSVKNSSLVGRWAIKFSSSEDPAVGIFSQAPDGSLRGTFLTTTGDYRFLAGRVQGDQMILSCFDGAHAFLFKATWKDDQLEGNFWSSSTWHETFSGQRDANAALPDSFKETLVNQDANLKDFEFPDLNGKMLNLDDETFRGQPRLIYVFGSWCPNCHDAAAYFSELDKKYGKRGLSILGIAFELTGDFQRDANQVKKYLARHDCKYPVVIAGLSSKQLASKTFPLLDRIRSYPTTIFVDRNGKIIDVHTGFTGPATGDAYRKLKEAFEARIESMLDK